MKFSLKNLGLIKDAGVSLNKLTIICGRNNTGKSYLTHSLYGALSFLRDESRFPLPLEVQDSIRTKGMCSVDVVEMAKSYWERLNEQQLNSLRDGTPKLLGKSNYKVDNVRVGIEVSSSTIEYVKGRLLRFTCDFRFNTHEGYSLQFQKAKGSSLVECRFIPAHAELNIYQGVNLKVPETAVDNVKWIVAYLVRQRIPRPFIIGSERTGVSVFRDEFNIFRSLAFSDDVASEKIQKLRERFLFNDYPVAIRRDQELFSQLPAIVKGRRSFLATKTDLLNVFEKIAGGRYDVNQDTGTLSFIPEGESIQLSLNESSSSVRSLCEIYFYICYCARRGDVLIVDEPEMNLNPVAQRNLARFIALLIKNDIRVFVTTHSDYLIREFNALIRVGMLADDRKEAILKKYKLQSEQLLATEDVNIYVIQNGVADLVEYDATSKTFGVSSFDDTIEAFNNLYNDIQDLE